MRQGHQNRRGRGRNNNNGGNNNNNNNRKGQNPLTRTFESNGPDVKIRGTPAHIAEKYMSLARDAKSSGDEVLAESYLQHAEHYIRIIIAYREQQAQMGGDTMAGGNNPRFRLPQLQDGSEDDEFGDDGDDNANDPTQQPVVRGNEPQPSFAPPQPFENGECEQRGDRQEPRQDYRHDRSDRQQDRQHGGNRYDERPRRHNDQFRGRDRDRGDRQGQGYQGQGRGEGDFNRNRDRGPDRFQDRGPDRAPDRGPDRAPDRGPERFQDRAPERAMEPVAPIIEAPPIQAAPAPVTAVEPGGFVDPANANGQPPRPREGREPRRRERFQAPAQHEQPEFLRRPVRRPRREAVAAPEGQDNGDVANGAAPHVPPSPPDGTGSRD